MLISNIMIIFTKRVETKHNTLLTNVADLKKIPSFVHRSKSFMAKFFSLSFGVNAFTWVMDEDSWKTFSKVYKMAFCINIKLFGMSEKDFMDRDKLLHTS